MRVLYLSVFSLLFISSCATRQPRVADPEQHWQKHLASVAGLPSWRVSGRVAVKTEQDGWTASFSWRQTGDDYTIRLHGPLGRGMVELSGNPQRVLLKQSGQPVQSAASAEDLLFQATGWMFPVSGLRYWILGVPVPGQKEQHSLSADGSLQRLDQAGWQTDYKKYHQVEGLNLPAKLHLANGKIEVKLIAREWQLSE